ncbi:MAG: hypothetical protein HYV09_07000 [Deltaproteobacteria bacterium]|nr:hypothetical protein [Deltaproteobacteria bacterium]
MPARPQPPSAEGAPAEDAPEDHAPAPDPDAPLRDVPIDWEALEDAFENNAPEVHSYLQLATGEVIRVVDGVADPQMHARIAADPGYLRVDPVSSREQYRWMERFIPMVESADLRGRLHQAIDGKGAFRRFKDVLMAHAEERERWFTYRSERLKTFMDAWLQAHSLRAIPRPAWNPADAPAPPAEGAAAPAAPREQKRKSADALRRHLREVADSLGPRDLDLLCAFGDFLRARRVVRAARSADGVESDGDDFPSSSELRAAPVAEEK